MQMSNNEWDIGLQVWSEFVELHPELGYRADLFSFHNFLRHHRPVLVRSDAIRKAKGRWWIGHRTRFFEIAFACATLPLHLLDANEHRDAAVTSIAGKARHEQ